MNYELITFDWDGTLFNSIGTLSHCITMAFHDLNYPLPKDQPISQVIGLSLSSAVRYLTPEMPPHLYPELAKQFQHHYRQDYHQNALFDGILELLIALKSAGYQLAIATGKTRQGLDLALKQCNLAQYFDYTRTADETKSKPHPQMLNEILQESQVMSTKTLMIGDTTFDIEMAHQANCAAVGVSYGAHLHSELVITQPIFVATTVASLHEWLLPHA
ncbi:MAG: HAD-IA family hydrolase [Gammaproteobacteria bacterium]|nr:HAD-IA family hydrolase [Gammaproteobacteria bacterium]